MPETCIDLSKYHGKNGFTKISKNLARYKSENNFVGQNDYIAYSSWLLIKIFCSIA